MNMLTLLLESQLQTTLTLRIHTSINIAGLEGNPFYNIKIIWKTPNLTKLIKHSPVTYLMALVPIQLPWRLASTPAPAPLHALGNANTIANYHEHYQTFINNCTANGAASNANLTASYVPIKKRKNKNADSANTTEFNSTEFTE